MLHNLGILFRQLRRSSYFTILKVTGLTIGFSVFVVLFTMVRKELSYDDFWINKDQLYRIGLEQYQEGELQIRTAKNYRGLPDLLVEEFPEVESRCRLLKDVITLFVGDHQIQDVDMFYADTNVFGVLPRKILDQESTELFPDIHSAVISSSIAMSLYGTTDVVGREIKLNEGWTFYVSAVFEEIPENSHLHFDFLLTWPTLLYYMQNFDNSNGMLVDNPSWEYVDPGPYSRGSWGNNLGYCYVLVKPGTDMVRLRAKAEELVSKVELPERIAQARLELEFMEVDDIHLKSDYPDEVRANSSMFRVYMLVLIAVIVLIISLINFVNLFAVDFHERKLDTAIRVINGADRRHIHSLILQKGLLISLIGGTLSFVFIRVVIELFDPGFSFHPVDLLVLAGLVIISGLMTVMIPMASFESANTMSYLKREVSGGMKGTGYRRAMVLVQFTASIILIASTIVIFFQMEYTRKKDLGFDPENIIYSYSPMTMNQRPEIPDKLSVFRDRMSRISGVEDFCVSSSIPGKPYLFPGMHIIRQTAEGESEYFMDRLNIDAHYLDTYGIELLAGENFRDNDQYTGGRVLLNRSATEMMGFDNPADALGIYISSGIDQQEVIGVVEDYHHLSLKSELVPVVFFKSIQWRFAVGFYTVKLASWDQGTIDRIAATWKDVYPGEQYLYTSLETGYMKQYESERSFASSFMIAALLAILISCLGLLGLSKYNAMKRTKEIGIRKAFGATSVQILKLLQSETVILVIVSAVLGIPVSWYIMKEWLSNFAFRIDAAWWMFGSAGIITLLIAMSTVIFLSWKVARTNPVDTLKYE